LAILVFLVASTAIVYDLSYTSGVVREVVAYDANVTAAKNASVAATARENRRFVIREDRESFRSLPVVVLDSVWLPKVRLTPRQISLLGPLFAIAYFMVVGKLAQRINIGAWLRFLDMVVAHFRGKDSPFLPAPPPLPLSFVAWVKRTRPWFDYTLGFLLLLDVGLSTGLARELQLHVSDPAYVKAQLSVHMAALCVAALYFGFAPLVTLLGRRGPMARSSMRRQVLGATVLVAAGALTQPVGTALAQLVRYGRVPNPRYRHHKRIARPLVKLPHGLYRNPRSGKIYFVDRSGRVSTHSLLKIRRLVRVSKITETDFPQLTPLAAKTCFEKQALSALGSHQLADAIAWLELGIKYEIFRCERDPHHHINNRVVKLFAGLCYRYRLHGRIPAIRRLIEEAHLVAKFQPAPQRWLTKAGEFRLRWRTRNDYAGIPL